MKLLFISMFTLWLAAGCAGVPLDAAEPQGAKAPQLTAAQLLEIADELQRRGDTQRSEQYYMVALERGADERAVLPRLLSAYVRDRQYRLAAQRAEDHLRKHPNDVPVRLLLAALYEAVADYSRAVSAYHSVIQGDDARADAHFALATILSEQTHDRAGADVHFRRYLALAPHGLYADRARASLLTEVLP